MAVKLPFVNPATGETFGEVAMATAEDARCAREQMGQAAAVWSRKPVAERVRIVRRFQKVMIDAVDEITATVNQDTGKSRQDALIEVFMTAHYLNEYTRHAEQWLQPEGIPRGIYLFKRYYLEKRPYGVVAVIGPWNYPITLALTPALAALLAGNTVILKPSEVTAATSLLIEKLFRSVPELSPFVRVLHGDGSVGAMMVESAPDMIFLTGSTPTGKKVARAAAENLTPVIFELGGKDPMIVLEDADVKAAARWGAFGAFYNAGQTCIAIERAYVTEPVYDDFVREAVAYARDFQWGYSTEKEGPYSMGPLAFERQAAIVEDHLADALAKGARLVAGGRWQGMFLEPTVLVDVDHRMKIMRDETFGPILPIMKVKDEAEAIRLANDSDYGLGAAVWSRDIARGERVAQQLQVGTALVNDTLSHFAVPHFPFGGVKQSGGGRVHSRHDVLQFTQTHAYAVGRPPAPMDLAAIMRSPGRYWLGAGGMQFLFGVGLRQRLASVRHFAPALKKPAGAVVGVGLAALLATVVWRVWRGRG